MAENRATAQEASQRINPLKHFLLATVLVLPGLTSNPGCRGDDSDQVAVTRTAISRSLPYLAERGQWWVENKECVSCHRTAFQIWAHAEAAALGFDVDGDQLAEWTQWSWDSLKAVNDKGQTVGTTNLEGSAQLLWVMRSFPTLRDTGDSAHVILQWLKDGQQEGGSWKPGGQLPGQKRPKTETEYVFTMWNLIYATPQTGFPELTESALAFIRKEFDAQSTEWLVTRLLVARLLEGPPEIDKFTELLLSEQNEDGGWGWIRREASDPMATGQVLFALAQDQTGQPTTDSTVAVRAVSFLTESQAEDGSWPTKGTKQNARNRVTETATYWGTAWAAIGLLKTLPNPADG